MHQHGSQKSLCVAFFEHRRLAGTSSASGTQRAHSKGDCELCALGIGRTKGRKRHLA